MKTFESHLKTIRNKRIAIVYAYRDEDAPGFGHYDYWDMSVVSDWAKASEQLGGIPLILDVRTFCQKAMNETLPIIDIVVNLNAGNQNSSTLGLVPSICGFLSIPCLPSDTTQCVTGEDKSLSNLIARGLSIKVPEELEKNEEGGIYRPKNLGSSVGVRRGRPASENEGLYQEFISGYDITTPILYNPISKILEVLPAILYVPSENDLNWFLGENEKESRIGYIKKTVEIDRTAQEMYLSMARSFGIKSFCRIDARLQSTNQNDLEGFLIKPIPWDRIYFLEINTMPTITEGINFCNSLESVNPTSSMGVAFQEYFDLYPKNSLVSFILASSILALSSQSQAL